jgi:hypothetical protein
MINEQRYEIHVLLQSFIGQRIQIDVVLVWSCAGNFGSHSCFYGNGPAERIRKDEESLNECSEVLDQNIKTQLMLYDSTKVSSTEQSLNC